MPRHYTPVEVKAIPWAKVLAHIALHKTGVRQRDLAKELKVEADAPEFTKALDQLLAQGRIVQVIGSTKDAPLCTLLQVTPPWRSSARVEPKPKQEEVKGETYDGIG